MTNKLTADGQWDLALYGGYPIVDPDTIRTFATCSAIGKAPGKDNADFKGSLFKWGGANYSNYCNPKFDDLMLQASKISDQAARAALYKQAQDIYLADIPIMIATATRRRTSGTPPSRAWCPTATRRRRSSRSTSGPSRPDDLTTTPDDGGLTGNRQPAVWLPCVVNSEPVRSLWDAG